MKKTKKNKKSSLKTMGRVAKKVDETIEIFSVPIYGTQKSQVLKKITLQRKEMLHVATVNPEFVMEARSNPRFGEILTHCYTVADGWGVVWGLRLTRGKLVERVSGVELVEEILKKANERREKVFLLGAREGVAEAAAAQMSKKYPNARLSWYEGARSVSLEKSEEASMTIAKINSVEPDYLFVAYGSPWQDMWIEENRPCLRVRVAMGVGGVLDEWAGVVKACPAWIDRAGGKWLWRLVNEPKRWRRILRVFAFAGLVMYHKLID